MVDATAVAFVGTGRMGARMARRVLDAGHELWVWNRTSRRSAALVEAGASAARSPAHAAANADVVVTMVSDPAALRAVTEGPDGIAAGIRPTSTFIDMSTVGPAAIDSLSSALPAGVDLLDAPVLGSISEAESGNLRVFVGGPTALVARWEPFLGTFGKALHVGPLGAGAAAKLVANATLLGVLGVLGEAVALARGMGLDDGATFAVLASTPVGTQSERRRAVLTGDDPAVRFALAHAHKDANLIVEAARDLHVDVRLLRAALTWLADAHADGRADDDYSTVLQQIAGTSQRERGPSEKRDDRSEVALRTLPRPEPT